MSWKKITEQQNPASTDIDEKSIHGILTVINNEDGAVATAVQNCLVDITGFINVLVPRLQSGGRLIYVGSGTSGRLGVLDAAECPPTFSVDPELVQGIIAGGNDALVRSIEGAEDDPADGARAVVNYDITAADTILGITASC